MSTIKWLATLGLALLLPAAYATTAVVFSESTGRYGVAWNESGKDAAIQKATEDCRYRGGGKDCKPVKVTDTPGYGTVAQTCAGGFCGISIIIGRRSAAEAERDAVQDCNKTHGTRDCRSYDQWKEGGDATKSPEKVAVAPQSSQPEKKAISPRKPESEPVSPVPELAPLQAAPSTNTTTANLINLNDVSYWIERSTQCHEIMLKSKGVNRVANPDALAVIAEETIDCLKSMEEDLRSMGALRQLESCFVETFDRLPPQAREASQVGVIHYIEADPLYRGNSFSGDMTRIKNTLGINNRHLIFLKAMAHATAETRSALSYIELYKKLFVDVAIPKRELNKGEIARYQREVEKSKTLYRSAMSVEGARLYLRRMAGPEGDALEPAENTQARRARFAECWPLEPILGGPLQDVQEKATWAFQFAYPVFDKRMEKTRGVRIEKARVERETRAAEIREARLQEWRKKLKIESKTNFGIVVGISQDGKKALIEKRRCSKYEEVPEAWGCSQASAVYEKSQCVENNGAGFVTGRTYSVCAEYVVVEKSWKNLSELQP